MGVKMITFSVGVELKNIKKNSENTFFMYLFIYNLINENHAQKMDMLFPKKEKKRRRRLNLKWIKLSYSFCLASPW